MDAVLLTWRWQNVLSIWLMVIGLYLLTIAVKQVRMRAQGEAAANAS
jgi:hypothetical protein